MNRIIRVSIFTAICLVIFSIPACRKNRFEINPEKINLAVDYRHLERDLFPPGPRNPDAVLADIKKKIPRFLPGLFQGGAAVG